MRSSVLLVLSLLALFAQRAIAAEPVKYVRFEQGESVSYGILEGNRVRKISGDLFGRWSKTETTFALKDVKLLPPTQPSQVLALAGNYKSHLNDENAQSTVTTVTKVTTNTKTGEVKSESNTTVDAAGPGDIPEKFKVVQPFFKSPSCLIGDGDAIVLPRDSKVVHYEAELVIVIGKRAKNVPPEKAMDYVFGVTCGNDISERVWQKADVQWWRAKGSDTFGPVGPVIATGLNYDDLQITLRLNGEVKQQERTSLFIQNVPQTVSAISKVITLQPGDLIFTGTPGKTSEIKPGDVVEVEIEGVGVLRNPVVAEK